jgi:hypothetical protein
MRGSCGLALMALLSAPRAASRQPSLAYRPPNAPTAHAWFGFRLIARSYSLRPPAMSPLMCSTNPMAKCDIESASSRASARCASGRAVATQSSIGREAYTHPSETPQSANAVGEREACGAAPIPALRHMLGCVIGLVFHREHVQTPDVHLSGNPAQLWVILRRALQTADREPDKQKANRERLAMAPPCELLDYGLKRRSSSR